MGDDRNVLEGFVYDRRPRRAFAEGFAPLGTPSPGLLDGSALSADMGRVPYRVVSGPDGELRLEGTGNLAGVPFVLSKAYRFFEDHFSVSWSLSASGRTDLPDEWKEWALFAELPLTLLAGHDSGRTIRVEGRREPFLWDEPWEHGEVRWYRGEDDWSKTAFLVELSGVVRLIHAPIETVSLSESGLERTFQGTLFIHAFPLARLCGGEASVMIFTGHDSRSLPHA
ncbi:MAG: 4-alpha-glucanotransferase [Leptospirillum sp. Group IV 'UBA BS']|nr:MAG: 4-alpha-glucanotransferase [Leptospirillum sp. Group IV 'UBA BS']